MLVVNHLSCQSLIKITHFFTHMLSCIIQIRNDKAKRNKEYYIKTHNVCDKNKLYQYKEKYVFSIHHIK